MLVNEDAMVDELSSVCQLLLTIHRWELCRSGCSHNCPCGLLHTHSPSHFLPLSSSGTLQQQHQRITQNSLDWAPGWPNMAESANLHRLRDNTNYRGLIMDLLPRIHVSAFISLWVDHTEPHDVLENIMSWDETWINSLQHPETETEC